jgi:hypothetical protein
MTKHDRHGQHIYGTVHQKERKRWIGRVRAGGVLCWRCGDPIDPSARWDLGHVDEDGRGRGYPLRHPEGGDPYSRSPRASRAAALSRISLEGAPGSRERAGGGTGRAP